MGQTLSEPETAKDTCGLRNSEYRVGSSCMQGWRVDMEDSHTHILSLPDDPGTSFFAVYDGHGGAKISDYAGKNLHKYIIGRQEYKDGDIKEALKSAFLEMDQVMLDETELKSEQSGSTAVVTVIKDGKLYCANLGDSRAVACVKGKLEELSQDHKPNNPEEFKRINSAGGWVCKQSNRVCGNLALSRALGDYRFKKNSGKQPEEQIVTALPDIEERTITEDWDFIVLACDGIWEVMSNEEVVNFVIKNIANGLEPDEICEKLMMRCLAPDCWGGLGCDNMTVVIVALLHGNPYENLQERCKKYCEHLKEDEEKEDEDEENSVEKTVSQNNEDELEKDELSETEISASDSIKNSTEEEVSKDGNGDEI